MNSSNTSSNTGNRQSDATPNNGTKNTEKPCLSLSTLPSALSFLRSPIALTRSSTDNSSAAPSVVSSSTSRKERKPWTTQEDFVLTDLLKLESKNSRPNWTRIAESAGYGRTGKQCRERWQNHLRPNIKKGNWTIDEEEMIRNMHQTFGSKWSCMAKLMKHRTDNDIKNKWNSMQRTQQAYEEKYGFNDDEHKLNSASFPVRYSNRRPRVPAMGKAPSVLKRDTSAPSSDEAVVRYDDNREASLLNLYTFLDPNGNNLPWENYAYKGIGGIDSV